MIDKETCFIGCDWGTSTLRMAVVEKKFGKILAQISSSEVGIKQTYQDWQSVGRPDRPKRIPFFLNKLRQPLSQLTQSLGYPLGNMLMVISGMASSSIGMLELPYAQLPFELKGQNMKYHTLDSTDHCPHPVLLLSGVEKVGDVMRGEETQVMGLNGLTESSSYRVILPGTHAKHIAVEDGKMKDFTTFMTGEVFDILGSHSILSNSLEIPKTEGNDATNMAFDKGVLEGRKGKLLAQLFSIRAKELQGTQSPEEGYSYLSGLLLGNELASLEEDKQRPVYIIGNPRLYALYQRALGVLGLENRLHEVPYGETPLSFRGQIHLLRSFSANL
ncbi:MAG: 2-dehydro-3-deoxygalactonokinase [Bacteroidota bacterium]